MLPRLIIFNRLLSATPSELPVLRDALKTTTVRPDAEALVSSRLRQAGRCEPAPGSECPGGYDPDSPRWESVGGKVAQALVTVNPLYLGLWLNALRPVRGKLNAPLAAIFRDKKRPETEQRTLATNILADYASDDPNLVAELLMDADPKAYAAFFPIAQRQEAKTLPLFQAEIARKLTFSWNDPPLDPSWTAPDATLTAKIESAQGMLAERFAFCQTMPLEEFLKVAEAFRPRAIVHPVPPLCRGQEPPGGGGLDPRRASLAARSRSVRRRDPPDRRAEPQGGISFGRCRRIPGCGWG